MPLCEECGDHFDDEITTITFQKMDEIERIYCAVAAGEKREDILNLIYDLFGSACELRPPASEIKLCGLLGAGGGIAHG